MNKDRTALIIIITILAIGVAIAELDTYDLDALQQNCNTTGSYMYRTATNWTCVTTLNITGNLIVQGNMSIKRPYAMFSDNTTQTIKAIQTPQLVNFSHIEDIYQITLINNTNITVQQQGDYLIEISAITKSQTQNKRFEIWVQKNGINIPRSNTIYDFKGVGTAAVISVPFILDLQTNDTLQIYIAGDSTDITMFSVPETTYSPATPSIILTINKISEITP